MALDKYSDDDKEREIGSTIADDAKILANTLVLFEVEPPLPVVVAGVAVVKLVAFFVPDPFTAVAFSGSSVNNILTF